MVDALDEDIHLLVDNNMEDMPHLDRSIGNDDVGRVPHSKLQEDVVVDVDDDDEGDKDSVHDMDMAAAVVVAAVQMDEEVDRGQGDDADMHYDTDDGATSIGNEIRV